MLTLTSHELAKELLSRPDGYITATHEDREYSISSYKKVVTEANYDDKMNYWTLNLNCYDGSIL